MMTMLERTAPQILDKIRRAEEMYPAGTAEHDHVLGSALRSNWPLIKAILTGLVDRRAHQ